MRSVTFRSKLDGWVSASLYSAAAVQIVVIATLANVAPKALFVVVPLVALISAISVWLYRATQYVVTNDRLLVRSGIFSLDISLADITKIEPTRNPLSAPAWSLDRLSISYGQGKSCMISPKDKTRFLGLLRERGVSAA
jgi:membrane protein YdbS with pleckstrin-like domain